jgi:hypothetical protein
MYIYTSESAHIAGEGNALVLEVEEGVVGFQHHVPQDPKGVALHLSCCCRI